MDSVARSRTHISIYVDVLNASYTTVALCLQLGAMQVLLPEYRLTHESALRMVAIMMSVLCECVLQKVHPGRY